jgi:hypothetical protein
MDQENRDRLFSYDCWMQRGEGWKLTENITTPMNTEHPNKSISRYQKETYRESCKGLTSANKNFFTKSCTSAADPSNCNAVSACSRDKYHV